MADLLIDLWPVWLVLLWLAGIFPFYALARAAGRRTPGPRDAQVIDLASERKKRAS